MGLRTETSPYREPDDAHLEEERAVDRAIIAAVEDAKELRVRRSRRALTLPRPAVIALAALAVIGGGFALSAWLWPGGIGVVLFALIVIGLFAAIVIVGGRIPPGNGNTSPPMHP